MKLTDTAVFSVPCPQCGAEPRRPCTYVWISNINPYGTSQTAQWMRDRVGKPTKVPHQRRREEATRRERQRFRQRQQVLNSRARRFATTRAGEILRRRSEVVSALRVWERDEAVRMRAWLARYAHILTDVDSEVPDE